MSSILGIGALGGAESGWNAWTAALRLTAAAAEIFEETARRLDALGAGAEIPEDIGAAADEAEMRARLLALAAYGALALADALGCPAHERAARALAQGITGEGDGGFYGDALLALRRAI